MGLVPLFAVSVFRAPRAYWWLALAFAVSFVADSVAHVVNPALVSRVYPVLQSALVAAVFLSRREVLGWTVLLVSVGIGSLLFSPPGPELALHLTAWLLAAVIASEEAPRPLRRALVTYFGLGALAWVFYVLDPGWASWIAYQGTRAAGIGLFGWATLHPVPPLRAL